MAAKAGSAFTLQKGSGSPYTDIGGFRTKEISINSELVDVTTEDDTNRFRQLLASSGILTITFTGSGRVKDTAAQQALITDIIAQTVDAYLITVPGIGTFAGNFQISGAQSSGEHNDAMDFSITLESGGDITFTAEGV